MTDWLLELAKAVWLLIPAYFASAIPVVAHGTTPIDIGRKWFDGNRIFGDTKTIGGFVAGVVGGFLVGALQSNIALGSQVPQMTLFLAFIISFGALVGDLAGSFIKRRFGMKPGEDAPFLDQLNFVFGATFFAMWFVKIGLETFFIMIIITPILHRIANIIAYKIKAKKVPW